MKNNEEKLLDNLFSDARQQTANLSFEDISNQFKQSVNGNVSTQLTKKWYSKLFNLNTIIIMLSTLLVSGIVLFTTINFDPINEIEKDKTLEQNKVLNPQKDKDIKSENENSLVFVKEKDVEQSIQKKESKITGQPITKYTLETKTTVINQPDIRKKNKKQNINESILKFEINEYTTLAQLKKMNKIAENHGLFFDYSVTSKKGEIKKLDLSISTLNNKQKDKTVYFKGNYNRLKTPGFDWDIYYKLNSKGMAVELVEDLNVNIVEQMVNLESSIKMSYFDSTLTRISIIINEFTTQKELDSIKVRAEKAGLIFLYKVKYTKKGQIKYLNLKMLGDTQTGGKLISQYFYKGSKLTSFKHAIYLITFELKTLFNII